MNEHMFIIIRYSYLNMENVNANTSHFLPFYSGPALVASITPPFTEFSKYEYLCSHNS